MADAETVQQVMTWLGLVDKHFSAISALAGGIIGGILVYFREKLLKSKDFELHYFDRILDKRVLAHENLIPVVSDMRVNGKICEYIEEDTYDRFPIIFLNKEYYINWGFKFQQSRKTAQIWLEEDVYGKLSYLQNYLLYLDEIVDLVATESETDTSINMIMIGRILQKEFFDLSLSIEDSIRDFFKKAHKLNSPTYTNHSEYDHEKDTERLRQTILIKRMDELKMIAAEDFS